MPFRFQKILLKPKWAFAYKQLRIKLNILVTTPLVFISRKKIKKKSFSFHTLFQKNRVILISMKNNDPHKFEQIASILHGEENEQRHETSEIIDDDQDFIAAKKIFDLKEQVTHLENLSHEK